MFEVRDVAVDATAESAAAARDQALAIGQREAFYRLLQRLTLRQHRDLLPNLDTNTVATYVRDFSVSGEKTSDVRYLARINVRFKESDIRTLLHEFGLPFSETASKPAVVLPVLNRAGAATLWREPNPWRSAWASSQLPSLPVPLLLPVGDIEDVGTVSVEMAMIGDRTTLQALASRYNAGAAIVVRADIAAIGAPHVELTVTRHEAGSAPVTYSQRVFAAFGETVDNVLDRAVHTAVDAIEESWKSQNLMRFDEGGIIAVSVPLRSLKHWLVVRQQLAETPVIDRTDLVLLSRQEALLNIHYIGGIDQLTRALAQSDLTLREFEGVWSLLTPETLGSVATP
ncbi:MAG: DUF2066 domain-containing protein [Rhodospirillales bacterium]